MAVPIAFVVIGICVVAWIVCTHGEHRRTMRNRNAHIDTLREMMRNQTAEMQDRRWINNQRAPDGTWRVETVTFNGARNQRMARPPDTLGTKLSRDTTTISRILLSWYLSEAKNEGEDANSMAAA